jgi:Uma2 family endonuclease
MVHATTEASSRAQPAPNILPLEAGDRLTRVEFERRYRAMPALKKAELVEGVVYVPSPVSAKHSGPHADLVGWLMVYRSATPGLLAGDNATVRFDEDNEPQPDALLAIDSKYGGQSRIDEDGYFAGPPELIAEVASSSVSYDLHDKLHVYRRHGVREYLVWRVSDGEIDWFRLDEGKYAPHPRDASGIYKSSIFPGLWLDDAALMRGDLARVLALLQEGIAAEEHVRFVAQLDERRRLTNNPG